MYLELEEKDFCEIRKKAVNMCCFRFLDVGLTLFSDNENVTTQFETIYKKFLIDDVPEESLRCYIIRKSTLTKGPCVIIEDVLYRLPESISYISQAELMIFQRIIDRIGSYMLLHAGVVSKNDNAYIIYAMSSFGKTTLILELLSRGYKFLSDEYCPVNIDDFSIAPFPRSLGLKNSSSFLSRIDMDKGLCLENENKIFVEDISPRSVGTTCKAKYLLMLTDRLDEPLSVDETDTVELMLFNDNKQIVDEITAHSEIKILEKFERGFYAGYHFHIPPKKELIRTFHDIWKRHERDVYYVYTIPRAKPNFNHPPAIAQMEKSETVLEVLTNLINRSPASKLLERCGGKNANILLKIGKFIEDVACYRMKPGTLHEMADIIDNL